MLASVVLVITRAMLAGAGDRITDRAAIRSAVEPAEAFVGGAA